MVLPGANPTKSYWIEAAESPLRDFRSTQVLPTEADIVIIGSGYAGASTAYWLSKVRKRHFTMSIAESRSSRKMGLNNPKSLCLRRETYADLPLAATVSHRLIHLLV